MKGSEGRGVPRAEATRLGGSEGEEQAALFVWASWNIGRYPELRLMFHVPNGGSRNKIEAAKLKAQGVKAGVPDVWLPVARGAFHGLVIEMKVGKNKPTKEQKEFLHALIDQSYCSEVCYGWEEAREAIERYLSL